MQQEAALPCQHKRVHDSQDRVDGVGICRLPNPAAVRCRLPLRAKVSALQGPPPGLLRDSHIGVGIASLRARQVDVELDFSTIRGSYESGIAVLQHGKKAGVAGIHADGHAPDFDDEAELLDLCR